MLHVEGDLVVNFTPNHNHELEYKNVETSSIL
jgi:hypothetical protein